MDPTPQHSPAHAGAAPDGIASLDFSQTLEGEEKKKSDDQVSIETEEIASENTWIAWLQVLGVIKPFLYPFSSFLLCFVLGTYSLQILIRCRPFS